jgi:hypothetical protein
MAFNDLKELKDTRTRYANIISLIILIGFIAGIARNYIYGMYFKMGYPYNTFVFYPEVRFTDLTGLVEGCRNLNPYLTSNFSGQLPALNLVCSIFSIFPKNIYLGFYITITVIPFLCVAYNLTKDKICQPILNWTIIGLLNYPILFTLDRGNLEGIMFTVLALFTSLLYKQKYYKSAVFLGLSIAIKGFSVFYLPIFHHFLVLKFPLRYT